MNLSHDFWFNLIAYLVTGCCAIIVVAFRIGQMEAKLATKDELREKVKERNEQINRVYERFDDFKRIVNQEMVRKDMCGTLHVNTKDELKKLDEDYKNFRHEIRNQIQMLVDKIDQLKELIIGNK